MTIVSKQKIAKVQVLLEGDGPSDQGWWAMYCPYHEDNRRSAGLNVDTGEFVCHGCNQRKTIDEVIADKATWKISVPGYKGKGATKPHVEITEAMIEGWHSALLSTNEVLRLLILRRGLNIKTIQKYELGWDITQQAYTIPIRDAQGQIANVRFYQMDVPEPRRKIWSVSGMGEPVLWPLDQLDYVNVVVCEGEMDAMLTIQNGVNAITRTGAADVWRPEWSELFHGKIVYLCHDADAKGTIANRKVGAALRGHTLRTTTITLPFDHTAKHGKDLTDYWMEGHTKKQFIKMAMNASLFSESEEEEEEKPLNNEIFGVNVMDSFDAALVGQTLQMKVTVIGKRTPSYAIPQKVLFTCAINAPGNRCDSCQLQEANGELLHNIEPESPLILRLVNVPEEKMIQAIQKDAGIVKCNLFAHKIVDHRTVEEAYVRASIEDGPSHSEQDFTHRRILSSVSHDLTSNESVILTGTIRPHPKNQENEFQAWGVAKPPTGLDKFGVTPEVMEEMQEFKSDDPMAKMKQVADDIANHHTKIFGREDLHIFIDLVFHSVLELPFKNSTDSKGWLDAIVLGDTRTGKSATARAMVDMYGAGEMISCEAATFAGVVGGLDHMSDGSWIVKWGTVPVFDRRIAVLDETSGLSTGEISQMSNMRSEGKAELTKIKSEQARARTRLLWLGNARDGKPLNTNVYAVNALGKLIGNNEDIARFDMAMCVFKNEVPVEQINQFRNEGVSSLFSQEAYRGMLQWAWTRKGSDIRWGPKAADLVNSKATMLGLQYVIDPPLLQGENARMKIARVAAAMAARTFSSTNGKTLLINAIHVEQAATFIDLMYSHKGFGYKALNEQAVRNLKIVHENMQEIKNTLGVWPNLLDALRADSSISFLQMKTILGHDDEVRKMMSKLLEMKAAIMTSQGLTLGPAILQELRGMLSG